MNYKNRITKIKTLLQQEKLDAILISSVANITYLTGFSNFFNAEREAYALITKESEYIFTDLRYSEAVAKEVLHFTLIETTPSQSYQKILKTIANKEGLKHVGIEEDNLTVAEFQHLQTSFKELHPIEISKIREIKEQNEIDAIEKACEIGDKTFEFLLTKIKEGITEKELAFELEFFVKKNSADISFAPIVAFGSHSSVPHHQTNDQRLKTNEIVLLDFGTKVDNYCSDMTRTVFFGKAPDEFKKMYETVRVGQEKAIELLYSSSEANAKSRSSRKKMSTVIPAKAGIQAGQTTGTKESSRFTRTISTRTIDLAAREYIESQGFPSIPHSVGHGIGLQVHELPYISPKSDEEIKSGMVFSVEPGIYIPNIGGVRIEDLVAIGKNTIKLLTKSPKHLIEL